MVLTQFALVCAPMVVALVAAAKLPESHLSYVPKTRREKRLYRSLLLCEKLPAGIVGGGQIKSDIDRQTLRVAYMNQYPQRASDMIRIATIGAALLAALAAYYYFLWTGGSFVYLCAIIAVAVAIALDFRRAVGNFATNDVRCHDLFERLCAPIDLAWTPTDLFRKTPAQSAQDVLERAVDVRDRSAAPMSTVEAVNAALAESASRHRHRWATLAIKSVRFTATAYDWLLDHLLGPFFRFRLWCLGEFERRRIARAEKTGTVFKAAWLPTYYRAERGRVTSHWDYLHHARDPLLRWVDRTVVRIDSSRYP